MVPARYTQSQDRFPLAISLMSTASDCVGLLFHHLGEGGVGNLWAHAPCSVVS